MFLSGAGTVMITGAFAGCISGLGGDNRGANGTDNSSKNGNSQKSDTTTVSETATKSETETESKTSQGTQTTTAVSGDITKQQARQIATDRVGGTVLNVENESNNGTPVYEVEIIKQNGPDKEIDVARQSGNIVSIETDVRDSDDEDGNTAGANETTQAGQSGITPQQAGQIATNRVGGTVLSIEKDTTKGIPVYEVEIAKENGIGKEVDVNRQNGTIVEIENDSHNDDDDSN